MTMAGNVMFPAIFSIISGEERNKQEGDHADNGNNSDGDGRDL